MERGQGQAQGGKTRAGKNPAQEIGGAGLGVPFPNFGTIALTPGPAENP